MVEVLAKITKERSLDIANRGFDFGYQIPKERIHPLIKPCFDSGFIIAELKRASPSAGHIGAITDVANLAGAYLNGGANALSVLCEERHFQGSLDDLIKVKNSYPKACVLRKDFLQHPEEIDISYRAGADMVLLIVAMFIDEPQGFESFKTMYEECLKYGITPLIEVHSKEEIDFIAPLKPPLVGINSRDLRTFSINIPAACTLYQHLQDTQVIFESAITSSSGAYMVSSVGFNGVLCGSYLVGHNNPTYAIQSLKTALKMGKAHNSPFYRKIFELFTQDKKPAIKICGITNLDDALLIAKERQNGGVDMLGFILVPQSPRYIEPKMIKTIVKALQTLHPHILRIAVVNDKHSLNQAKTLYEQGYIHAIQLHGVDSKNPNTFANLSLKDALFCHYIVQNIAHKEDFNPDYEGVFCLVDSISAQGGGSGKSISMDVLQALNEPYLCIAGGINAENIGSFLALNPAMLDINSGVEYAKGKKDITKIALILKIIKEHRHLRRNDEI